MDNNQKSSVRAAKGCVVVSMCIVNIINAIPGAVLLGLGLSLESYADNKMNVLTILGIVFLSITVLSLLLMGCIACMCNCLTNNIMNDPDNPIRSLVEEDPHPGLPPSFSNINHRVTDPSHPVFSIRPDRNLLLEAAPPHYTSSEDPHNSLNGFK